MKFNELNNAMTNVGAGLVSAQIGRNDNTQGGHKARPYNGITLIALVITIIILAFSMIYHILFYIS